MPAAVFPRDSLAELTMEKEKANVVARFFALGLLVSALIEAAFPGEHWWSYPVAGVVVLAVVLLFL
jgi:hypothetical protein